MLKDREILKAILALALLCMAEGHQCGNGIKERGENSDSGNAQSQDGCDSNCWV